MPEGSAGCSCGLVPSGHPSHVYNQEAFQYVLTLEQKRAERSRRSLLLLLIRPKKSHTADGAIDSVLAGTIFSGLLHCVREGDFVGWYREGRVAGAVLTEGTNVSGPEIPGRIGERVRGVLAPRLAGDVAIELEIRVFKPRSVVQE